MKKEILLILTFSLNALISESRQIVCQKEDEVCKFGCYNPSTEVCLDKGLICNKGEIACGFNGCYDQTEKDCIASGSGSDDHIVCPKGHLSCPNDSKCYDPNTEACSKAGRICPIGEESCGRKCYNPSDKQCLNDKICEIGESIRGNQCYNSSSGKKCIDEIFLCEQGEEVCDYWTGCYNPAESVCYADVHVVCKKEEQKCDFFRQCYDPNSGKQCLRNKYIEKVCESTQELCGEFCYWPQNETCHTDDRKGKRPIACDEGEKACGYDCYDEKEKYCRTMSGGYQILCKLGENETCGYHHCYNKESKKCLEGIPSKLCNIDEELCDGKCYNPNSLPRMTCYDGKVLCKDGESPCGGRYCFNAETQKCVELKGRTFFNTRPTENFVVTPLK